MKGGDGVGGTKIGEEAQEGERLIGRRE